jgi:ribosome recycling factor
MEDANQFVEGAELSMSGSIEHLQKELTKVRAGKANPAMVSDLLVPYYGNPTPVNQVANVSTSDARTIVIQPWEKTMLSPIERSIFEANLGVTPQNDGEVIRISIPPLTEERRKDLVKSAKGLGEEAKVSIRNARRDAMEQVKKAVKDGFPEDMGKRLEGNIQELTDSFSEKVDKLVSAKEKEIMTI